jgi:hypothetical protein
MKLKKEKACPALLEEPANDSLIFYPIHSEPIAFTTAWAPAHGHIKFFIHTLYQQATEKKYFM